MRFCWRTLCRGKAIQNHSVHREQPPGRSDMIWVSIAWRLTAKKKTTYQSRSTHFNVVVRGWSVIYFFESTAFYAHFNHYCWIPLIFLSLFKSCLLRIFYPNLSTSCAQLASLAIDFSRNLDHSRSVEVCWVYMKWMNQCDNRFMGNKVFKHANVQHNSFSHSRH